MQSTDLCFSSVTKLLDSFSGLIKILGSDKRNLNKVKWIQKAPGTHGRIADKW